ncbi:uncharacterized protein M6B38_359130 [Iris pallida]|uniref:Uncharacterized protein n=1 Tax=Iris pallida TaxID=29817 RepID=A0AAX6GKZ2_IRIPA|nr:uncharacterized protein M6B38_359130 [Iris pallida]
MHKLSILEKKKEKKIKLIWNLLIMGLLYKERPWSRLWRGAKTLFFLLSMLASLLVVCAPPLLVVLLDILLPSALLSAFSDRPFSIPSISSQLQSYKFDTSLVDVPLVSIARSLLILCAYMIWEGRGPYLGIATVCSFGSVGFVSAKAAMMLGAETTAAQGRHLLAVGGTEAAGVEAMFSCSLGLAVAHVIVAYRTSCRERRKLLVYKIDIEAVKLKDIKL